MDIEEETINYYDLSAEEKQLMLNFEITLSSFKVSLAMLIYDELIMLHKK